MVLVGSVTFVDFTTVVTVLGIVEMTGPVVLGVTGVVTEGVPVPIVAFVEDEELVVVVLFRCVFVFPEELKFVVVEFFPDALLLIFPPGVVVAFFVVVVVVGGVVVVGVVVVFPVILFKKFVKILAETKDIEIVTAKRNKKIQSSFFILVIIQKSL